MYLNHNMTRDDLFRHIDDINPMLAQKIETLIETEIESAMDNWGEQEEFEKSCHISSIEVMEMICLFPEWIQDKNASTETYYINGIYKPFHYENHNVSITKFNKTDSWCVELCCGTAGQEGWKGYIKGSVEDVQRETLGMVRDMLKEGKYFRWQS